jgi:hypothetical protein
MRQAGFHLRQFAANRCEILGYAGEPFLDPTRRYLHACPIRKGQGFIIEAGLERFNRRNFCF